MLKSARPAPFTERKSVLESAVLRALTPLDGLRALGLRGLGGLARPLLRDRGLRIGVAGLLAVATALVLTCAAPLLLLTLSPLLLGVPHLLADVRYLVVRQGFHRRASLMLLVAPCLLLAVLDGHLRLGLLAVALTALVARAAVAPRALCIALFVTLAAFSESFSRATEIWFAHAHNLVALVLWMLWSRRTRALVPALLLFVLGAAALLFGALDDTIMRPAALTPSQWALDANLFVATLSPFREPLRGIRFVAFFAFAQAVHYGVWLRLLPEEDRARQGVRSFRASYRALVSDVGVWLPLLALALTLAFCSWGGWDVGAARDAYLRLAVFHGPLELAVLTLWWLEKRPLTRAHAGGYETMRVSEQARRDVPGRPG